MLHKVKEKFSKEQLMSGNFGIEREGLRCDDRGLLSHTEHPHVFGEKLANQYITTDFSESQLELITPVRNTIDSCYKCLENIYNIAVLEIGSEYIWPQSMPCNLPNEDKIPIATFDDSKQGQEAYDYRRHLLKKYGGKKQLVSGIHYNFSFNEDLLKFLYEEMQYEGDYKDFKDDMYLKVTRNYLRYRWLIIYLLGGASVIHSTYEDETYNDALSYRNSVFGYVNDVELYPNYTNIDNYIKSIIGFVREGCIDSPKELYSQIRLKANDNTNLLSSLKNEGISYLEYRSIDINPFDKAGVSKVDLYFMHIFNLYLLFKEETPYTRWQEEAQQNQYNVAIYGQKNIQLLRNGEKTSKIDWAIEILDDVRDVSNKLGLDQDYIIFNMLNKVKDYKLTHAYKIMTATENEGYITAHMNLAKAYKQQAYEKRYQLQGYEDLELSTQQIIKESIKRGIDFKIMDRQENFVKLSKGDIVQYVKQATKTSLDTYVSVLIMENKAVTKQVLDDNGIPTPKGVEFISFDDVVQGVEPFVDKAIVVKPKSTNYGLGISIFANGTSKEDILDAAEIAFRHDKTILVEEFIQGKEYRILVIGDEVAAVLHRVPANVVGDGKSSIRRLVDMKNTDPARGVGHKLPLEKIKLDDNSALFLKQKGLDFDYIPQEDEVVYLRENSNISTGGDSVDFTDKVAEKFKEIAIKAAKCAGANICGVDMIIEDVTDPSSTFATIELNFNPAIHMHCYPYQGKERNIAGNVLDLLGFSTK